MSMNTKNKKIAFYTLGCKLNQAETSAMSNEAERRGYAIVSFHEDADIKVINSCTLTNRADRKTRQAVNRARRESPQAIVALVGCLPQVQKAECQQLDGVDIILGSRDKFGLFKAVEELSENHRQISHISPFDLHIENDEHLNSHFIAATERTRTFLKIQEGCENFCTYCIVPYARGPRVSRDFNNTISEAARLAEAGYKEIVLTGIDIGSYNDKGKTLYDVVAALEDIPNLQRIRISSIEMNTLSEELIRHMGRSKKLMPHIHLSLQSGSNTILQAMKRKYSAEEFAQKMALIRKYAPDASIGTDVIVGFPGETDELFKETVNFIQDVAFSYLHVFRYSARRGTPAATMKNQVDETVKKQRAHILGEISNDLYESFSQRFYNTRQSVLWETYHSGRNVGHTAHFLKISLADDVDRSGEICDVDISGHDIIR